MSGGVNDVDLVFFPEGGHGSRRNRNAALFLLLHPVGRRCAVGFAELVIQARVEQERSVVWPTGVNVRHNSNVAPCVDPFVVRVPLLSFRPGR